MSYEIILAIFTTTTTLIILIRMIRTTAVSSKPNGSKSKLPRLPPGEMGLPWIGETMDFYKSQRNNRLFDHFVRPRMEKHGKIFKTRLMGSPTIVVNGAEANKFFLSNEFKLVVSSWPTSSVQLMGKNSIMEAKGDRHRTVRGLIAASIGYSSLEVLVPKMCRLVQASLAEHWGVNGGTSSIHAPKEVSLYYWTKTLTFQIVFECLLGIKMERGTLEMFEKVLEGVFAPPVGFPGSKFSRAKKAREEIERMLLEVVREKRKGVEERADAAGANQGGNDEEEGQLLWRLVKAMLQGEITEEEVVDNVVLLVFAAHDTTSFVVAMMFKMLAQHPDCYNLLLQEHMEIVKNNGGDFLSLEEVKKMKYTWEVARESMRLFPPIFGSFRKAVEDIEFDGFIIPKGWKVLWTAYGTHFSEEYFEDPMSFKPERFQHQSIPPYVYVPFGGGPRVCAGSQLAKLSILVLVHYVVTRYNWSLVLPNEGITMDPLPFPSRGMPIRITPKACGASNRSFPVSSPAKK